MRHSSVVWRLPASSLQSFPEAQTPHPQHVIAACWPQHSSSLPFGSELPEPSPPQACVLLPLSQGPGVWTGRLTAEGLSRHTSDRWRKH